MRQSRDIHFHLSRWIKTPVSKAQYCWWTSVLENIFPVKIRLFKEYDTCLRTCVSTSAFKDLSTFLDRFRFLLDSKASIVAKLISDTFFITDMVLHLFLGTSLLLVSSSRAPDHILDDGSYIIGWSRLLEDLFLKRSFQDRKIIPSIRKNVYRLLCFCLHWPWMIHLDLEQVQKELAYHPNDGPFLS